MSYARATEEGDPVVEGGNGGKDGEGDRARTASEDDRGLRARLTRLNPAVRGGLFVALLLVANLLFRDPLRRLTGTGTGQAIVAIPVLILGFGCLAHAVGPRRWVERERAKARRTALPPGVKLLGEASIRTLRCFFLVGGLLVTGLGVAAILEVV